MRSISIIKIVRDLIEEKSRTIIVLVAMILGSFSVTLLTTSNQILNQNLRTNYLKTNPASFTIIVNDSTTEAVNLLKNSQGIKSVEIRNKISARFRTPDNRWLPMVLFIVSDFDSLSINTFKIADGQFPDNVNEMAIERAFRKIAFIESGKEYQIRVPGSGPINMKVSGKVHDAGQAPSWMENTLYGYIGIKTAENLNIMGNRYEIKCIIDNNPNEKKSIENVLLRTIETLQKNNIKIIRTEILKPGEHPHESQMKSLMFLLQMFGILVLFLSCFLIINMISSIMNKQIRQIGIMKAMGASNFMVIKIYMAFVLILAVVANVIAIPLGYYVGLLYSKYLAELLNFNIFNPYLLHTTVLFLLGIGLSFPLIISLYPVMKTSRTSVNESLNDYGVAESSSTSKLLMLLPFSNIVQYSIRNAFRQKVRLVITLMVLILGGAIFISSFNMRSSSNGTVSEMFDKVKYDFQIILNEDYSAEKIDSCLKEMPNLTQSVYLYSSKVTIPYSNGLESEQVILRTVSSQSEFNNMNIVKGRKLEKGNSGVVINHMLAAKFNNLDTTIKVNFNNKIIESKIVGISRDLFAKPTIYFDNDSFKNRMDFSENVNYILLDVDNPKISDISKYSAELEESLSKSGININLLFYKDTYRSSVVEHLVIIMSILIMMTFLLLLVGGLGLATTISINVVERKRELGVLRSIGLTDKKMYKLLIFEGITTSLSGWFCSIFLSLPLSYYLGNKFFTIFFEATLNFSVSAKGILLWFLISLIFGFLAVIGPAKSISKMNVSQLIAYE